MAPLLFSHTEQEAVVDAVPPLTVPASKDSVVMNECLIMHAVIVMEGLGWLLPANQSSPDNTDYITYRGFSSQMVAALLLMFKS